MLRLLPTALLGAALLATQAEAADIKVGVVNLQRCFEEYYKTKQAEQVLKEAVDAYNKERQQMIGDFTKAQEDLAKLREESEKPELSAAVKAEKAREADAKLNELKKQKEDIDRFDAVRRQALQEQNNRMRSGIVKEITDQIARLGKAQNFSMIMDSSGLSANGVALLVFFEDRLDITADVIRELNRTAPVTEPAKPTGGTAK